ncbi:MAG: rhodanese-like domain-containing protein [Capnocytophaga sp.]|nr:rhodanese-like domain-containing protein [Capnocytophaga sp.]
MRKVLILAIGLTSCSSGNSMKHIAMKEYNPQSGNILVDLRTSEEFAEGHLKNAINIDFFDANFVENFENQFDKSDTIYIHCKSGGRSSKAMQQLETVGFKNIIHLDGGIMQWLEAGKPIEK